MLNLEIGNLYGMIDVKELIQTINESSSKNLMNILMSVGG